VEERNAEPHNNETKKKRIGLPPPSTRDVPSLAAGTALGDGDNGGDHADGNGVEIERIEESLKKEEKSL